MTVVSALTTNQDLAPDLLREAFGIFPSGVVAVAAETGCDRIGLAASSFTSVSLDPPLVSFSIANTSKTWPELRRASHLGLTVLAAHQGEVCRQLAGPVRDRFTGVATSTTLDGAVTLDEGLVRFDCTIRDEVVAGDHTIVILQIHAVDHSDTAPPLVFHRSGFGQLA